MTSNFEARLDRIEAKLKPKPLDVWRCPSCHTILAKVRLSRGSVVEIKCPRCNSFAVREAA
jgi:rubrerythrin